MRLESIFGENYLIYLKAGFKWAILIILVSWLLLGILYLVAIGSKDRFVGGDETGFSFGFTKLKVLDIKKGESLTLGTTFGPVFYLLLGYVLLNIFFYCFLIYLAIKKSAKKFPLDTYSKRLSFVFYIVFYVVLFSSIINSLITYKLSLSAGLGTIIVLLLMPALVKPKTIQFKNIQL